MKKPESFRKRSQTRAENAITSAFGFASHKVSWRPLLAACLGSFNINNPLNFVSRSEEETEKIGARLASHLKPGDSVRLYGGLGAGKTCLTRGITQYLHKGESGPVKSPCFTILNIYEGKPIIYHFDFYRVKTLMEVEELGLSDYWGKGICIVEWPKKFCISLPGRTIDVIMATTAETERKITANIPMDG